MAARTVDVVAHSMGGLVARYYLSDSGYSENPALSINPVHKLITIGTPHSGSDLATTLWNNQSKSFVNANNNPLLLALRNLLKFA
jgi:triacylglycerol esterase/lipase EstA (alpha/beta hydrolase family)